MKHKLFILINLLVIFAMIVPASGLAAGSLGNNGTNNIYLPLILNNAEGDPEPIIPETTKPLDETTTQYLTSISEDGTEYTFSQSTSALDDLEPGDVMAGDPSTTAPYGFLRKVTTVSSTGGQVVIHTEDATLEDAIQAGAVHVNKTLTPNDIMEGAQLQGVSLVADQNTIGQLAFSYTFNDVVLYDLDSNPITTNDQVRANGGLTLEPSFDFDLVVRDWRVEQLSFTSSVKETAELEIVSEYSGNIPGSLKKKEIASHEFAPILVQIGVLPVWITPVLSVYVGVDGSVHAGMTTSVTQVATLTGGVAYTNGAWAPISGFTNTFAFQPPVVNATLHAKGFAGIGLSLMIYSVVGPAIGVNAFLEFEADINATPWWTLYGGLEVPVSIEISIIGRLLASFEIAAIDYKVTLAQANQPLLLYFDDFSDPNSGWWIIDRECCKAGYLNGEYQILLKNTKTGRFMSAPDLVLLSDYRIEVDARQASSNASSYSYGLMFGRQISGDTSEHYVYRVGPTTQEYRLNKRNMDGSLSVLIDWTYSSAIHQGMGTNHLRVDRIGTVIYLYINDTLVTTFTDSSFTSPGRDAGVQAFSNYSAPVDVRFDNFSVYRTP